MKNCDYICSRIHILTITHIGQYQHTTISDNMNRYLQTSAIALAAIAFSTSCSTPEPAACYPIPKERQLRLQDMEMYAFIHYSLNTYTDQEWGYGDESPELFNPSRLDARQWAETCKNAGMKGIILTVKHHCGFCLWPSKYTEYSVKNAPWKDGKGDVVRDLSEACKELGLRFAVYLSPWDRNHPEYGRDEYVTYFQNQMRELLTEYGDIFEIWFDGANGGNGYYGGANEVRKIDKSYYRWEEAHKLIYELQPDICIWTDAGSIRGDLRWVGTEAGFIGETNWSCVPDSGRLDYNALHYGVEDGNVFSPGETNTSIRPGWFYHDSENEHVKSLSKLMDTYYKSVGRNSTLLLNFPVDRDGLIHQVDSVRGAAFYKMIQEVFKTNLAQGAKIATSNFRGNSSRFAAKQMLDGDSQTYWATDDDVTSADITLYFDEPKTFNRFMACENIALGQRVKSFKIEALVDGEWQSLPDQLADDPSKLTTIGRKRIICFPTVTAPAFRLTILDAKACPTLSEMGLYLAPDIEMDKPENGEKRSAQYNVFINNTGRPVNTLFVGLGKTKKVAGFRFLPNQSTKDGMPLDYIISGSNDGGKTWSVLARGEFSNIVNNPIWQSVSFDPTEVSLLKLDCDRITSGKKILFSDLEVILKD